jgi:hypothetical protein
MLLIHLNITEQRDKNPARSVRAYGTGNYLFAQMFAGIIIEGSHGRGNEKPATK